MLYCWKYHSHFPNLLTHSHFHLLVIVHWVSLSNFNMLTSSFEVAGTQWLSEAIDSLWGFVLQEIQNFESNWSWWHLCLEVMCFLFTGLSVCHWSGLPGAIAAPTCITIVIAIPIHQASSYIHLIQTLFGSNLASLSLHFSLRKRPFTHLNFRHWDCWAFIH